MQFYYKMYCFKDFYCKILIIILLFILKSEVFLHIGMNSAERLEGAFRETHE